MPLVIKVRLKWNDNDNVKNYKVYTYPLCISRYVLNLPSSKIAIQSLETTAKLTNTLFNFDRKVVSFIKPATDYS